MFSQKSRIRDPFSQWQSRFRRHSEARVREPRNLSTSRLWHPSLMQSLLLKNTIRWRLPSFKKNLRYFPKSDACPAESALPGNSTLTLLQSTLTKTLDLKSIRINTYKKRG